MQKKPWKIQHFAIGDAEKLENIQHFEIGNAEQPWKIQHVENIDAGNSKKSRILRLEIQHFEIGNTENAENPAILKLEFGKKEFEKKTLSLQNKRKGIRHGQCH